MPISDIFLHDRDTDEDGIFDESGGIDTLLVSRNPCGANLTNHSIEPSITYDGRFVVFATVAGNAKVDENCIAHRLQPAPATSSSTTASLGVVTRRLSEGTGGQFPGASGAPVLSGNGNLLLFRTQAVNAGGASSPSAIVAAVTGDGKSTTGRGALADHRHAAAGRRAAAAARPAAPRIRRPAATATPPATRPNPIPGPARASP